jgi:peptide/nickel transport system ATP-binding protein/oligopeptide transport system ATP-binding protein
MPLVDVSDLCVSFGSPAQPLPAVSHVDLTIEPGEIVGIAGESGSGKTTLCAALIRALPRTARVSGEIVFDGRSMLALSPRELRKVRGREISMILQNPMTSLDPLFTIGDQMGEVLSTRGGLPARAIEARELELLRSVHLTAPEQRLRQYPHELSGGMRQRILIAMANATAPKLLLADEPTTALDATIQEEILILFREIRDQFGTAIAIVTHDLGVIRRVCDRVIIMYAGRIVEEGPVEAIFTAPQHPYTRALLASIPVLDEDRVILQAIPGQVPDLASLGNFCAFAARCPAATDRCHAQNPPEIVTGERHRVFCWQAQETT